MLSKADRETITLEHWEQRYYLKTALRGACYVNSVLIMSISRYTSRETLSCVCAISFRQITLVQYAVLLLCSGNSRHIKLNKN